MPISISENLYNIADYLEKSNIAQYASNPIYMATIEFIIIFFIYMFYVEKITLSLVIVTFIIVFGMFLTFSYSYKKTLKPVETPIIQYSNPAPGIVPLPRISNNNVAVINNANPSPNPVIPNKDVI